MSEWVSESAHLINPVHDERMLWAKNQQPLQNCAYSLLCDGMLAEFVHENLQPMFYECLCKH